AADRSRECPRQGALADAGDVLDQQVAARDQADQRQIDDLILAVDPASDRRPDLGEGLGVARERAGIGLVGGDRGVQARGVYFSLRQNMIPSRIDSSTCSTRGHERTWALKRTIPWSLSLCGSSTRPLHSVLSARITPPTGSSSSARSK